MSAIGMNVSADGRHDGQSISDINCTWVRLVARAEFDLRERFAEYRRFGIRVLLVFDRLSVEQFPTPAECFAHYARLYNGDVSAWQVGNEPDLTSESSWTMPVAALASLGRMARAALPGAYIVCAGMASGQPPYLIGADLSWCNAVACHPYLKDAPNPHDVEDLPDVPDLLDGYQALGLPVWITEWGWWSDDEQRGAEEVDDMIGWAARNRDVPVFFYFCADDAMVAPFGLYTDQGEAKPRAQRFIDRAAQAVTVPLTLPPAVIPPPIPEPEPEPSMDPITAAYCRIWQAVDPSLPYNAQIAQFGIPTYWREHLRELGSPVGPEIDEGNGQVLQPFSLGIVRWTGAEVERVA